jgi:hypothetical protein
MNRSTGSLVAAILTIATVPAAAQWLNVPAKGIPRTKDGKPDLSAPPPRKPDGKPDISGVWQSDEPNRKYVGNLAADLKPGEFPIRPWAEAVSEQGRTDAGQSELPSAHCLPLGVTLFDALPNYPLKIVQEPDLVVILYEHFGVFRQVFLDGRELPRTRIPLGWGIRLAAASGR